MGLFADYVYRYGDLANAYESSGEPDYEQYVYNYGDLWDAYAATGTPDWAGYVNSFPDLLQAFKSSGKKDKAKWGQNHWENNGWSEGREVPFNFPQTVSEWGSNHWTNSGQFENRDLPKFQTETPDEWGQNHWNQFGQFEDRFLDGTKLSVDNNGNLFIANPDLIGDSALAGYQNLVNSVNGASDGTYKSMMEGLRGIVGNEKFEDLLNYDALTAIDASYMSKINAWDPSTGAQPPTGGFDPSYYRSFTPGGSAAESQWDAAQSSVDLGDGIYLPDLDIVERYTFDGYMHWHYTTQGKAAGYRGNEAEYAELADFYQEQLTDAEYEMYRDTVLGGGEGTILSKEVGTALSAKEKQEQQRFGSLTAASLKQAADELVKAKRQERDFEFYKKLEGFNEVLSINETIANSLLGDSGIGGVLGFVTNPYKAKESLEESLASATGIPSFNGVTYNWQKWFEEKLGGNYEEGITVQDPLDPEKTYTLDADFAKRYIEEYLQPRFDSSKSMSEFISTIENQQQGQNVLQVQTALGKLRDIAEIRAQAYLDDAYNTAPLNFNADFYMNPSGNFTEDDPKAGKYIVQKQKVAEDWETAKNNGDTLVPGTKWTWNQWAYYYGLNPNNKKQFAQLHYQIVGADAGFDPAKDVLTLKDASDYISGKILPEIAEKDIDLADVNFLQFVTPEEFADSVIEGVSPEKNKEEWDKLLGALGISGSGMGVDEVKQYITDQFRTGNAIDIRESIKYLNEKGKKPTQKELGVDYIQRPEDYKSTTSPYATSLYKVFKEAGYQGSEDDFYGSFMTDVDKGEMQLLEQGASEKGLQLGGNYAGLTSKDPFESLGALVNLFDEDGTTEAKSFSDELKESSSGSSYFKLLDDEEEPTKSKSAEKILGEFTSLFKGFT